MSNPDNPASGIASGVFQFASTALCTYQVMDIGRYVRRDASNWAMPEEMFVVLSSGERRGSGLLIAADELTTRLSRR
jgi:hypothetical protein